MNVSIVAGVLGAFLACGVARAQSCDPPSDLIGSDTAEHFFDDTPPHAGLNPVNYLQISTLRVAAFDVNKAPDAHKELIFGGNGADPNLVILQLQGWSWTPYFCFQSTGFSTCFFITLPSYTDTFPLEDPASGRGTSALYDFTYGDINLDTWTDVVVGRRLSEDEYGTFGERDTVFLNRGSIITDTDMCNVDYFNLDSAWSSVLPTPPGAGNRGSTFGVALGHIATYDDECNPPPGGCTDHLDLVTSGENYGIRYYRGNANGTFSYTLSDPLGYTDGTSTGYRSVTLGDVEGDGDLDMIVTRMNSIVGSQPGTLKYNSVWHNQKKVYDSVTGQFVANPTYDEDDPFAKSPQTAPLQWPDLETISWVGVDGTCAAGQSGVMGTFAATFEAALGDMDLDGDLDLVATSTSGKNAVYLNNGKGFFGSLNSQTSPSDMNNGCAAYKFPPMTPDWSGTNQFIYALVIDTYVKAGQPNPFSCAYSDYSFTVPGAWTNACTGVTLADVDADGLLDVSFSNRNDYEEMAVCDGSLSHLLPESYEYVFLNDSSPGVIDFCSWAERIEGPNDGTTYAEMVNVNRDSRPDWLDANFSNNLQAETNHLWWGKSLILTSCDPQMQSLAGSGTSIQMHLAVDEDWAGATYQMFVSGSGDDKSFDFGGAAIPIAKDELTDLLMAAPELAYGMVGQLDEFGQSPVNLAVPPELLPAGGKLWVVAAILSKSGSVLEVTNVVEVMP